MANKKIKIYILPVILLLILSEMALGYTKLILDNQSQFQIDGITTLQEIDVSYDLQLRCHTNEEALQNGKLQRLYDPAKPISLTFYCHRPDTITLKFVLNPINPLKVDLLQNSFHDRMTLGNTNNSVDVTMGKSGDIITLTITDPTKFE